jgi:hypothetical protein
MPIILATQKAEIRRIAVQTRINRFKHRTQNKEARGFVDFKITWDAFYLQQN